MYYDENASANQEKKTIQSFQFSQADKIAGGFSSCVYKGRNILTDETVAIKVIDLMSVKSPLLKSMLQNQIEALTALKEAKNVLKCYQIVREEKKVYFITELCDGGDLDRLVKQSKLTDGEIQSYLNQMIEGYLELSEKKILHRDIKPANIFRNSLNQIKIGDFGFCIKQEQELKKYSYSVGSVHYLSPEALTANKYSEKSDIWALGITVYQLLTQKTPWRGKNQKQLTSIYSQEKDISSIFENIETSDRILQFLKKTIVIDYEKRMSISEMREFLEKGRKTHQSEGNDQLVDLQIQKRYSLPHSNISTDLHYSDIQRHSCQELIEHISCGVEL